MLVIPLVEEWIIDGGESPVKRMVDFEANLCRQLEVRRGARSTTRESDHGNGIWGAIGGSGFPIRMVLWDRGRGCEGQDKPHAYGPLSNE